MPISRRKTLALIGGGVIVAAGAAGGYAVTRHPRSALAPWRAAGLYEDPRMRALSYAILAPNPHNRQPWKVDLRRADAVTLYVDTDRLLPHTDPFSRQIVIGLGCFLETLVLAAAQEGLAVDLALFPEGVDAQRLDARPVAAARFRSGGTPDPLFAHVLARRSFKAPADTERPVADAVLAQIEAAAQRGSAVASSNRPDDVAALRALTAEALGIELRTPRTLNESVDLFRIGHREVDADPDGIDFSGPLFETLRLTGQFSRAQAMRPGSLAFRSAIDMTTATARTGMAYIWQVTPGNTRAEQIAAGRDWMRLNLACTAAGLGVQPMSQALQEYPEVADLYAQVHGRLAPGGWTVQMLGRLGYGAPVPPSPRWPLEAKIMDA